MSKKNLFPISIYCLNLDFSYSSTFNIENRLFINLPISFEMVKNNGIDPDYELRLIEFCFEKHSAYSKENPVPNLFIHDKVILLKESSCVEMYPEVLDAEFQESKFQLIKHHQIFHDEKSLFTSFNAVFDDFLNHLKNDNSYHDFIKTSFIKHTKSKKMLFDNNLLTNHQKNYQSLLFDFTEQTKDYMNQILNSFENLLALQNKHKIVVCGDIYKDSSKPDASLANLVYDLTIKNNYYCLSESLDNNNNKLKNSMKL